MNPKSAIAKGKALENWFADQLGAYGIDNRANRQIGSGSGKKKGDIATDIGWTFECKNTKKFNWKEASEQVAREGMGYQKEAIVWHPPQRTMDNSVVIINVCDFLDLLKFYKDHQGKVDILDKYKIKSNLDRAVHHLKQVIGDL